MGRKFIVLGDTTTHGGKVISAWGQTINFTIDGKFVVCIGDQVMCPRCKGVIFTIIQGADGSDGPRMIVNGRPVAREGDMISDGSRLLSLGQSIATYEDDGEMVAARRAAAAATERSAVANQTKAGSAFAASGANKTAAGQKTGQYDEQVQAVDAKTGEPIPNLAYFIEAPDGMTYNGHTDTEGLCGICGSTRLDSVDMEAFNYATSCPDSYGISL